MTSAGKLSRHVDGFAGAAILALGAAMFSLHMVSAHVVFLGSYEFQNVHLAFVLTLVFLGTALRARSLPGKLAALVLAAAGLAATGYVQRWMGHLEMNVGFPTPTDVAVGVVLVLLVLEAARRAWGPVLPIVSIVFVAYFLFGHLLPAPFYHHPKSLSFVTSYLSVGLSGIYGSFLSISANQVFLFVVFGSMLGLLKINELFMELGKAAGRVFDGGPGQTAVVGSSLVGMVTGAAVANVAVTGAFTIPFMKKAGYRAADAGAIEATASTGGQIMPPVMGASAFLMASFMGVPYATVMAAAVIPAVLYYWCVILGVQFISIRTGIVAPKEPVDRALILRRAPLFAIPVALLVVLLGMRYSPGLAAFWTIAASLALVWIHPDTRETRLLDALRSVGEGAMVGARIGVSLAVVGLMAQTLITTGLGSKIAGLVDALSAGSVLLALVLTMAVSLVLGCGVPTSAAYALVALVVVPSLVRMGLEPIQAHFFAFYFAVISAITPPVALAALAGAAIAEAPYFRTAVAAFKLAISGFVIPFLIVYNPAVILEIESVEYAIGTAIAVPIGLSALTAALYGCGLTRFTRAETALAAVAAAGAFGYSVVRRVETLPLEYPLLAAGLVAFALLARSQLRRAREPRPSPAAAVPAHGAVND